MTLVYSCSHCYLLEVQLQSQAFNAYSSVVNRARQVTVQLKYTLQSDSSAPGEGEGCRGSSQVL